MAKRKLNIPVKRGDLLELDVETLASSGDGLSHHEGYTLFTPGGIPGDHVKGKVIKITPQNFNDEPVDDLIQDVEPEEEATEHMMTLYRLQYPRT